MYQIINETTVQRLADGAFIPANPANADYRAYLDWQAEGNEPNPMPPTLASAADVNAERDRRIGAGFAYGGKVIQFDGDSQSNILGACQMAALGILPQPFMWITSDNSLISLTPQQVIEMGGIGAAHKQQMIFAARALKDMSPIPATYADDTWWVP